MNASRDQLIKSQDRRLKHLMIRILEGFENYREIETQEDLKYKAQIRTIFNDVIRAQREELREYEVEYCPLKVTNENTVIFTNQFLNNVHQIHYGFRAQKPYISIYGDIRTLEALRAQFSSGVIFMEETKSVLEIVGLDNCINSVLPHIDKYLLASGSRLDYKKWRLEVIGIYRSKE